MASTEELANIIHLDDPLFETVGATCSWGVGNQLAVVAGNVGAEKPVEGSLPPLFIHEARWNKDMHRDITRKLLNESHQIFVQVQDNKNDLCKGPQSQGLLLKFSRKYRSVLRACVLELKSEVDRSIVENEDLIQQMELLRIMEVIWNLCEILFIENAPAGVVLPRLADWCRWHFTQADDFMEECIQVEQPHLHGSYWRAIKCLVLQGRTEDSQNMLKLHPLCRGNLNNAYTSVEELLRKMPHFTFYRGQSIVEFEMKWNHWQDECRRRMDDGEFDGNDDLKEIVMILSGNEVVFENPEYGSWHQMLVSRLLYTQPTVSMMDLQHHSKLSVEIFGGREHLGTFDSILLAAFELDPYMVIKECSQQLSNWWLAAHLADLFHHSGLLLQKKLDIGFEFRELLLLEYATGLMSHDSLWRVAIDYLSACSENGGNYLSLFVQKIPLTSEKKATKLLRICQERELLVEARSICRQMCMSALQHDRLGTALMWSLHANDSAVTMRIAEKMLKEYAQTGEFAYIDQLDNLGSSILVSERLTFLGKYRDFHKLLAKGQVKEAGGLLLSLLIAKIAPPEFWPSLLVDSVPLLEDEELVYNSSETAKLIAILNSINLDELNFEHSSTEKETMQKRLEHLRLTLSRNLARAIISVE